MADILVRTGVLWNPFALNAAIANRNFLNGRPLDEGLLPPVRVPDQSGLPEFIALKVPD